MKTSTILLIAVAGLGFPTAVSANEPGASSAITAIGRVHHQGWLSMAGPDERGRYTMRIDIADLDVASASGWSAMSHRVERRTMLLCDMAAEEPKINGYYDAGERVCWSDTMAQAQSQMTIARDAARSGQNTSQLGFGLLPLSR